LRRLAQRFGALADNAPRLWLLVGGTDARAIDPVESAPLSGGPNLREVVRSWEHERRPGGYSAFLVTNTPGDHSAACGAARRLIEHAAEALRALGDPVSERPLLRWAERLEGLADAGDAGVSITRRRVRPLAPEGQTPSPALGWTIGLRAPVDADGSGPWYGLIQPDTAEASRLMCLHLAAGEASDEHPAGGKADGGAPKDLRPARWFARATEGILNADTLRQAQRRGTLPGAVQRESGRTWRYSIAVVMRAYPEHTPAIEKAAGADRDRS